MALFDFLKRKKEIEKVKDRQSEKKIERVLDTKEIKKDKKTQPAFAKATARQGNFSYTVVKEPHISEKATNLAGKNKYVFKVYGNSNKPEIQKSIEGIYGVDVVSVNTIKIPAKKRRLGKTEGFRKGYVKAIVTIREGQKIETF